MYRCVCCPREIFTDVKKDALLSNGSIISNHSNPLLGPCMAFSRSHSAVSIPTKPFSTVLCTPTFFLRSLTGCSHSKWTSAVTGPLISEWFLATIISTVPLPSYLFIIYLFLLLGCVHAGAQPPT